MSKETKMIFPSGKEEALKSLFIQQGNQPPIFGYLALGYDEDSIGFETEDDFKELSLSGYTRPQLTLYPTNPVETDVDGKKVTVRFKADVTTDILPGNNITINQIAVVNKETPSADDKFYCASTFSTFQKDEGSSLTFVLSFRL